MTLHASVLAAIGCRHSDCRLGLRCVYLPRFYADAKRWDWLTRVAQVFSSRVFSTSRLILFRRGCRQVARAAGPPQILAVASRGRSSGWRPGKFFMPSPGVGPSICWVGFWCLCRLTLHERFPIVSWSAELSTDYDEPRACRPGIKTR